MICHLQGHRQAEIACICFIYSSLQKGYGQPISESYLQTSMLTLCKKEFKQECKQSCKHTCTNV